MPAVTRALVLPLASVAATNLDSNGGCGGGPGFDYYLQVQQWPAHFGVAMDTFTIHGFWPSRVGDDVSTYPCQCRDEAFDASQLDSLSSDLESHWPSLMGKSADEFHSHEWTKHGTCSTNTDGSSMTQVQYFQTALSWRAKFASADILKKAGVTPGAAYPKAKFDAAFKAAGLAPILSCESNDSQQNSLSTLSFCVTKDEKVTDCDPSVVQEMPDKCDDSADIFFAGGSGPAPAPGPSPAPAPTNGGCPAGAHGPPCHADSDCADAPNCVRCAHSGFCTSVPAVEFV